MDFNENNTKDILLNKIKESKYELKDDIIIFPLINEGNYIHICPLCNRKHKGTTSKSKWCKSCYIILECKECHKYFIKESRQSRIPSCCSLECGRKVSARTMNKNRDILAQKQGYKNHNEKIAIINNNLAKEKGYKDHCSMMREIGDKKAINEGFKSNIEKMHYMSDKSAINAGYKNKTDRMIKISNEKAILEGYSSYMEKLNIVREENAKKLGYKSFFSMIKPMIDKGSQERGFSSQFEEMKYLSDKRAKELGFEDSLHYLWFKRDEWFKNMSESEKLKYSKSLSNALYKWWKNCSEEDKNKRFGPLKTFMENAWKHYAEGTANESEIKFCESGYGYFDRDAFYASDYDICSFEVNGITESDISLSDFVAKYDNVGSVKAYELVDENNNLIETLDVAKTNGTIGEISWFHRTMKVAKEQKDLSEEELLKLSDSGIRLKRRKYLEEMDKYPNSKIRIKIIFSYDHKVEYNSDEEKYLYNIESQYTHDSKALFWSP